MRALAADGRSADEVRREIGRLEVRPVLTAHPTEATRKTLLTLQSRWRTFGAGSTVDAEGLVELTGACSPGF